MSWSRGSLIGTIWGFVTFTLILVCIRVYVRVTTQYQPWREALTIFAWLSFLTQAIATTCAWYHVDMVSVITYEPTPPDAYVIYAYKMTFIWYFCITNGLNACKAVLLLTCFDVCNRHLFPKIWWSLIVTSAILFAMEFGVALIYTFLQCHPAPLNTYWSATEVCWNKSYIHVLWISNTGTDIILAVVPLILVFQLKTLTGTKRIGIAAMFAVGFLNVIILTIRLIAYMIPHYAPDSAAGKALLSWNGEGLKHFLDSLVLPTAIIVVCVPQLRVLGRWSAGRRMASSLYQTFGGKTFADTTTLAQSTCSKVAKSEDGNMNLKDEEKRWVPPKMMPETTVIPKMYRVTSETTTGRTDSTY